MVPLNSTRQTTSEICGSWSGYNDWDEILAEGIQISFPGQPFPPHCDCWLLTTYSSTLLLRSPSPTREALCSGRLLQSPNSQSHWLSDTEYRRLSHVPQGGVPFRLQSCPGDQPEAHLQLCPLPHPSPYDPTGAPWGHPPTHIHTYTWKSLALESWSQTLLLGTWPEREAQNDEGSEKSYHIRMRERS